MRSAYGSFSTESLVGRTGPAHYSVAGSFPRESGFALGLLAGVRIGVRVGRDVRLVRIGHVGVIGKTGVRRLTAGLVDLASVAVLLHGHQWLSPASRTLSSLAWSPSRWPRGQPVSAGESPDSLLVTATRSAPSSRFSRTFCVFGSGCWPIQAPPSRGGVSSALRLSSVMVGSPPWPSAMQGPRRLATVLLTHLA